MRQEKTPELWRRHFDDTRALNVLLRQLADRSSPIDGIAILNAAAAADGSSTGNGSSRAGVAPATEALEAMQATPVLPVRYAAPPWLATFDRLPKRRMELARLPTPIHRWDIRVPFHGAIREVDVFIKRDDLTGSELGGNKVRKLEFLLADALERGCDSVVTVGGIQSNHCRATAAACARLGLRAHLVLRAGDADAAKRDPGVAGNLMVMRLCGAQLHLISDADYASHAGGAAGLVRDLSARLAEEGALPYAFTSGGSCGLGCFGYVEAVAELERQLAANGNGLLAAPPCSPLSAPPRATSFDTIYFACGSGGTAAGLALGLHLSSLDVELVGIAVDDSPAHFYAKIDALLRDALGDAAARGLPAARELIRIEDGVGEGYARSTPDEIAALAAIARQTGVVLDPVYTLKAVLGMARDLEARSAAPCGTSTRSAEDIGGATGCSAAVSRGVKSDPSRPRRVLFIHTGGLLGLFDKSVAVETELSGDRDWQRYRPT